MDPIFIVLRNSGYFWVQLKKTKRLYILLHNLTDEGFKRRIRSVAQTGMRERVSVCVCVCVRERETDRQTDREREKGDLVVGERFSFFCK